MKQVTQHQAIEIAKSGIWKEWSDEEIVRFQLFQDRLCMDIERYKEALSNVMERPVHTHELNSPDELKEEYLGCREAPTMEDITKSFVGMVVFTQPKG